LTLPRGVHVFMGEVGENCNKVCEAHNYRCAAAYFPHINNCPTLKKFNKFCDKCELSAGRDQPAYAMKLDQWYCYINAWEFSFNCWGSHREANRLCPCIK